MIIIIIDPAKLIYLNFHPLEIVSRYRDLQLQVAEHYSYLFNLSTNICKSWCLDTHFIYNSVIWSTKKNSRDKGYYVFKKDHNLSSYSGLSYIHTPPSKHEVWTHCWLNIAPSSTTCPSIKSKIGQYGMS